MEADQESRQVSRLVQLADTLHCENARLQTAIDNAGLAIGVCQICDRPCVCEPNERPVCVRCYGEPDCEE